MAVTIGQMREDDWISLTSAIETGTCILMLGPDAFMAEFDGETLPVAVGMARWVMREKLDPLFGPDDSKPDPSNPWAVAQVAVAKRDGRVLRGWVEEFYRAHDTVSEAVAKLATLPFELIINTSPGLTIEKAFDGINKEIHSDFYNRRGPAHTMMPDPSRDKPVVYNLFGSLKSPTSVVLSEIDRLDFLVSVIKENPPLPEKLLSRLRDRDQSFLFIGFDLAEWQLRMLMHVLANNVQREYTSFALEWENDVIDQEARSFYMSGGHKLQFVDMDVTEFTDELSKRITSISSSSGEAASTPVLGPNAPMVFLCHAHEDAVLAKDLSDRLCENSIKVWLDRDGLLPGDRWDPKIEQAIERDVEYFVVMQSAHLKQKDEGYVNKEIAIALDRQKTFRETRTFVIPAIVDNVTSELDSLAGFQRVDLTQPDGIDSLVRTIKRDRELASRASRVG